jgi:ribonuclease E
MPNKMLIDATHPEETRVVVVRGNRVEEFDFETAQRKQLRGNIYLAKVTRVEPSLQAAFIEYGGNRHGFLAFSEIHPDYYQIPVADRQALIEAEERAHREAEEESENRSTRRRSRHRNLRRRGSGERVQSAIVDGTEAPHAAPPHTGEPGAEAPPEHAFSEAGDETALHPASPELSAHFDHDDDDGHDDAHEAHGHAHDDHYHYDHEHEHEHGHDEHGDDHADHHHEAGHAADFAAAPAAAFDAAPPAQGEHEPAEIHRDHDDHHEAHADAHQDGVASDERPHAEHDGGEAAVPADEAHALVPEGDEALDDEDEDDEVEEEVVESVGGDDALEEVPERAFRPRRQYKIQEVIKRRQVMLVQVVKEERGNKGAALTTYLSLAGRYAVLMPNTARGGGISRKITSAQDLSNT